MSKTGRRVLALVSDAYGGLGGIAAYNRDVFQALSEDPSIAEVVVVPRVKTFEPTGVPDRIFQRDEAMASTGAYLATVWRELRSSKIDLVHCAHLHLAPIALLAARKARVPWTLSLYGWEAWQRRSNPVQNYATARASLFLPISDLTDGRFRSAFPNAKGRSILMPNALHRNQFSPGPKNPELERRYDLTGHRVVMTMARIGHDYLFKGFDRIIRIMPDILADDPSVRYLICGDGPSRGHLQALADDLGVGHAVLFSGYVSEHEKAEHYRLADAFVMPSIAEGFGFVFTEAMACGIPVVASSRDGGTAAVLGGKIGQLVDPFDPKALRQAIDRALDTPRHVPKEIDRFDYPEFRRRLHQAIAAVV